MKKTKSIHQFFMTLSILLLLSNAVAAAIINVPLDQPTIQAAINVAIPLDVIIVADGTYTGVGNKDIDFLGKAITVKSQNGPAACIIDCQGVGRGFRFHLLEKGTSVLKGFTIMNGNGGIAGGGGIQCDRSSPTIRECIITLSSGDQGAGIKCDRSSARIINCVVSNNTATLNGGGVACDLGRPKLVNCLINGNNAGVNGGAFSFGFSNPTLVNCTVSGNIAPVNGGIKAEGSIVTITNCILWGDTLPELRLKAGATVNAISSNVQGMVLPPGNISMDPLFLGPGDFHLTAGSPCIDTGDNASAKYTDLDGKPRIADGNGDGLAVVDMGAFEL